MENDYLQFMVTILNDCNNGYAGTLKGDDIDEVTISYSICYSY